jgi:hypothetical protein
MQSKKEKYCVSQTQEDGTDISLSGMRFDYNRKNKVNCALCVIVTIISTNGVYTSLNYS